MANLIWTGILYFSTSMIVYVTYRTFMNDRRAENERRTADTVLKSQTKPAGQTLAMAPRQAARKPTLAGNPIKATVASR